MTGIRTHDLFGQRRGQRRTAEALIKTFGAKKMAPSFPSVLNTGLPDFSWYKIPKREKIYQITANYTNCP
jgi:hypothetical protein